MAVDSRDKRMSMIGLGSPVPRILPNPAGAFADAGRAMLLYLYYGIALGEAAAVATLAATIYGPQPSVTIYGPQPSMSLESNR